MKEFRIEPKGGEKPPLRVVDMSTGEEVYAPDIAARGLGIFAQAVDAAGGEMIIPDDISELMRNPDELEE